MGLEIHTRATTSVMATMPTVPTVPSFRARAAAVVAFGTWDIGYYVFLWLFSGWPASPGSGWRSPRVPRFTRSGRALRAIRPPVRPRLPLAAGSPASAE